VEVAGGRATLAGTSTLAGSVIALDDAVRNLVSHAVSLPDAVAAASRNPLELLGIVDRGRIAVGQRADLVELDSDLTVRRVMRGGTWLVDGALPTA
jgi:N-acetylglucosamine-6-phosphate deacetylase